MKKTIERFSKMIVAMIGLSVVPGVHAQDDNVALMQELTEANQDYVSQAFDYDSDIYLEINNQKYADLKIQGKGKYNVDSQFSGEADIDINGEMSQQQSTNSTVNTEESEAVSEETAPQETSEVTLEPVSFQTSVVILDNIAYALEGEQWHSEDISEELKEVSKSIDELKTQVDPETVKALNEKLTPYMNISETDSEYIVSLKDDIDSESFWADVNEVIDIESIKEQAIKDAEAQAKEQGVQFTDAQRDQVVYFVDKGLAFALDMISNNESHYDKESKKLTKSIVNIAITEEDLAKIVGMDKEALGMTLKANIDMEFNFTNHGETFDIQAPEGATSSEEVSEDASSEEDDISVSEQSEEELSTEDMEEISEESQVEETTAA